MVVGDFPIELDTVVVGAGPGGYVAAIRAAQLGQKVAIIEKANLGGVCLNVGCIPSKALINAGHRYENAMHSDDMGITAENVKVDFTKVQEWKNGVVKKLTGGVEGLLKGNKVEIIRGEAYFVDANTLRVMTEDAAQTYTFKNAVLTTGFSAIRPIPRIATSGWLITGVNHCPPAEPMFVIVQEAPFISAGARRPSRALPARSLISLEIVKIDLRSVSLTTGTNRPLSVSAAIPILK